jgi:hypothetical protein
MHFARIAGNGTILQQKVHATCMQQNWSRGRTIIAMDKDISPKRRSRFLKYENVEISY